MRPADMLTKLFQHLLRTLHMMSLEFGHSAAQSAAPLCGAPAPFICTCAPTNTVHVESATRTHGKGAAEAQQVSGEHALLEMSDCVTEGVKAVAFTAKATPYASIWTPCTASCRSPCCVMCSALSDYTQPKHTFRG